MSFTDKIVTSYYSGNGIAIASGLGTYTGNNLEEVR